MLLNSDQAGALLSAATRVKFTSVMKVCRDHGIRPTKFRGPGGRGQGGRYLFSASQFAGILLFHVLRKTGLDGDVRAALLSHIAGLGDEALEAMLADGRHFVFKFGRRAVPELWTVEQINHVQTERADVLRQLGVTVEVIDIKPFISQLFAAARKLTSAPADQPEAGQCSE